MTNEQLLYKTLCNGLANGLKCNVKGLDKKLYKAVSLDSITAWSYQNACFVIKDSKEDVMPGELAMIHFENVKPILRNMSSITEKDIKDVIKTVSAKFIKNTSSMKLDYKYYIKLDIKRIIKNGVEDFTGNIYIEWFIKHDYNYLNLPSHMYVDVDSLEENPYK